VVLAVVRIKRIEEERSNEEAMLKGREDRYTKAELC